MVTLPWLSSALGDYKSVHILKVNRDTNNKVGMTYGSHSNVKLLGNRFSELVIQYNNNKLISNRTQKSEQTSL